MSRGTSYILTAALLAGCASAPRDREAPPAPQAAASAVDPGPVPAVEVPRSGPLSPSEMTLSEKAPPTGAKITGADDCESCHSDVAAQWRSSAHAFASFTNPAYRVSVDRFRHEVGPQGSRHCGGCHDIALMADGVMDRPVQMAGDLPMPPVEASDRRAKNGVSCRVCHGIEEARPDGNGSYTLAARPIPLPMDGDPESVRRHKESTVLAPLRQAALCGTCHRAFLGEGTGNAHFLVGQDELGQWARSVYAKSQLARIDDEVAEKTCQGCHMPKVEAKDDAAAKEGKVISHRFPGGHTWMASMRNDADQLAAETKQLQGAASIDVAAVIHPRDGTRSLPADGAPVAAGEPLVLDVVVKNQRVGHRFPSGTMDAQDAWVEVTVDDARGRRVAEAGTAEEKSGDDPTAHVLKAWMVGKDGVPLGSREINRFAAVAVNHTIPPRDAIVVELSFDAPASLSGALPLKVTARLRHRSRTLALQRAACADAKTPWGRAYAEADRRHDPCKPQPVTEVARAEVFLGAGSPPAPADPPVWRRLHDHALGLSHAVQERLDEARPSLQQALAEVEAIGTPRERAMVTWSLGWLEAHEGRTEEALRQADRAAALLPGHPAIAALRGEALSLVWRWAEAVPPLDEAARAAPGDDGGWTRLAIALGSRGGDDRGALAAALSGLKLSPRDPDLLRAEALALRSLRDPGGAAAEAAYDAFRPADAIPGVKARCSMNVPGCALERSPVHAHRMRQ